MIEREKRYHELRARGFYFEDDEKFNAFLTEIEDLSKKYNTLEKNYYYVFERILGKIEKNTEGETSPKGVPALRGVLIKVFCKKEPGKDPTEKYKIRDIKVTFIKKLMEHENTRYS